MRRTRGTKIMRLILAAATLILAAGVYAVTRSGFFSIKTISCNVDGEKECSSELMAELGQYIGKNPLLIRTVEIEKRITSAQRQALSAEAKLRLPNSLIVSITSRKPAAAITSSESFAEAVTADSEGVILGKTDDPAGLARLVWPGISGWPIEERLPETIVRAMSFGSLAEERFRIEGLISIDSGSAAGMTGSAAGMTGSAAGMTGSAAGMTAVMRLKSGEKVWLGLDKEPVEQLTRLQLVLNQVRIESRQVSEIDLRFDNPVLRYE